MITVKKHELELGVYQVTAYFPKEISTVDVITIMCIEPLMTLFFISMSEEA